nr:Chain B, DNA mismatch repair protein Mlh1 [Homo sapiens]6WBB_C Chain C, DNA mismatch repair protein Mlh1 [Homo sapiens]
SSNPRKRHRAD